MRVRIVLLSGVLAAGVFGCGPTMPKNYGPHVPRTEQAKSFTHETGIKFVVLPVGLVESRVSHIQLRTELRRPILMSAHEVTNAQFEKFAPGRKRSNFSPGDSHPVANVTPQEAEAFCKWLTANDPAGRRYKLPDMVEWEYAARGGQSYLAYPWGNEIDRTRACYRSDGAKPVGSYPPNKFGLYDMAGSVAEWVWTDDIPAYGLRGGGWRDNAAALRLTELGKLPKNGEPLDQHGFRVVCDPPLILK